MHFQFVYDGGHGWLIVNRSELDHLKIANKISEYSYQDGDTIYLEEDRDAPIFTSALGFTPETHERDAGDYAELRRYPRYTEIQKD
jgi:hypothetical protein